MKSKSSNNNKVTPLLRFWNSSRNEWEMGSEHSTGGSKKTGVFFRVIKVQKSNTVLMNLLFENSKSGNLKTSEIHLN